MASASLLLPLGSMLGKSNSISKQRVCKICIEGVGLQSSASEPRLQALKQWNECAFIKRRNFIHLGFGLLSLVSSSTFAGLPPEDKPKLCDDACEKELENVPMVTTESGLQYKDIKIGGGPSPPVGYQVAANYVAMVPSGQIFDRELDAKWSKVWGSEVQ